MAKDKGIPGVPVDDFVEEFCTKPYFDEDGVQAAAGIGLDGKEYGDPVPMSPPVGYSSPPDLMQMIRSMVRNEQLMQAIDKEGFDTFDEAGDFDVEDDIPDPKTPYERLFDPPPPPEGTGPQGAPPSPPSPSPSPATAATGEGEGGGSPKQAAPPPDPKPASTST